MKYPFWPERVFFEPAALEYPRGSQLYRLFLEKGLPVKMTSTHNRVTGIPGTTHREDFIEAKKTLVIGVRRSKSFQSCKPSAEYQLPLATGCPGGCRYCYLHTSLGRKPYLRVYINIEEILQMAGEYIKKREPDLTRFEGSAVSDPLFMEPFTGGAGAAINYFAGTGKGLFRLATKFTNVEPFLKLEHGGRTCFRFSLNAPENINKFEMNTPLLEKRLEAAAKIAGAGYPTGFLIAPLFLEDNWRERYADLLHQIARWLPGSARSLTFELITHRFTLRAKRNIENVFGDTGLNMDERKRQFRYGQFGYGKYMYPRALIDQAAAFFNKEIKILFHDAKIEYFI